MKTPVVLDEVDMVGPSMRVEMVIDFTGLSGKNFTLINTESEWSDYNATTNKVVMQFRVNKPAKSSDNAWTISGYPE